MCDDNFIAVILLHCYSFIFAGLGLKLKNALIFQLNKH